MTFRDSEGLDYKDVLLVPQYSTIDSRAKVDISGWLTPNIALDIPVVSANMDTITNKEVALSMAAGGSAGILHRYANPLCEVEDWIKFLIHYGITDKIIPSIGVGYGMADLGKRYLDLGANAINIDIAHGDSLAMCQTISKLSNYGNKYVDIIAGNIATKEAARRLIEAGAMTVKVGIGPGFVCDTRKQTGSGYPQLSAIMEIAPIVHELDGCLIADGGIREIGDCCKALAAGADSVMSGYLFRGSEESQSNVYRGMASSEAQEDFKGFSKNVEGHSKVVETRGHIRDMLKDIKEGIQSGFSYSGCRSLDEFQENAEFVVIK